MTDGKYEKLERMRQDIQKDRERMERLQEQIRNKEARLREAEGAQIVADAREMKLSPEQLGAYLALIQSGKLDEILRGKADCGRERKTTKEDGDENE